MRSNEQDDRTNEKDDRPNEQDDRPNEEVDRKNEQDDRPNEQDDRPNEEVDRSCQMSDVRSGGLDLTQGVDRPMSRVSGQDLPSDNLTSDRPMVRMTWK